MHSITFRRNPRIILISLSFLIIPAIAIVLLFGFKSMDKNSDLYIGPSIKIYDQVLQDNDFNRYLYLAQQATRTNQMNAKICDIAVTSALRDIAMEREIQKVAAEINLRVSKAEVDKQIKKRLPTEEELQLFMERQGYKDKNEFKKAVVKSIQWERFMINKAHELKIEIPKSEVLGFLEQIAVSHIFVGVKDPASGKPLRTESEAYKRANEVYQKTMTGENFTQLAKEYSDYPASKERDGIYYGPMTLTMFEMSMEQDYVNAALALKKGEISKPVKTNQTQSGYYIIRLESRNMPKGIEYQAKYREIEHELLIRKVRESSVFKDYLQRIYQDAEQNMVILDPALKAFRLKQAQKWNEAVVAYQQALQKSYYQNQIDIFMNLADVYLELKQPKKALQVLKQAPVALTDNFEFQKILAVAYKDNNELQKAQDILVYFGKKHSEDLTIHENLKIIFTVWNLPDLVAQETRIISDIQKKGQKL